MSDANSVTKKDLTDALAALEKRLSLRFDRLAETIATEVGSLHLEIQGIDRRLRNEASLTTTLHELVVKQTRWHEESDNAVRDMTVRQTEFARKLNELRREDK